MLQHFYNVIYYHMEAPAFPPSSNMWKYLRLELQNSNDNRLKSDPYVMVLILELFVDMLLYLN